MKANNKFDINKFNLPTIIPLLNNPKELVKYFKNLSTTHPSRIMVSPLLDGASETTGSILQNLKTGIKKFSNPLLPNFLIQNDIDFSNIIKKPHIFFVVIPDEKTDRHMFATLFITEIYKFLIELADNKNKNLERAFYFLLDEFGNIPLIQDMDSKITVSRIRNIWWSLILQNTSQLTAKYGRHTAEVINDNCSLHIFFTILVAVNVTRVF